MKSRVLYLVNEYPQLSQTYIKCEIEALQNDYEISIIALDKADLAYKNHLPFKRIKDTEKIIEAAREFNPGVIHAHYLTMFNTANEVSRALDVPFTVRAHSFDALMRIPPLQDAGERCLGVLAFPFTHSFVNAKGIPDNKIIDCYPVINYERFYDRSPNGDEILNVGATIPKKGLEAYLQLGKLMPNKVFNLYAIGYYEQKFIDMNKKLGNPVNIMPAVEPEDMKPIYKRHRWLVYTANPRMKTIGWSMAIAEAQAAGLGICMQNVRPDLSQYVGGAGFLFNSIRELPVILSRPYPEEMRERGFEQAKKSDIQVHKVKLTSLWDKAIS